MIKLTPKIFYENYKEPCEKLQSSIYSKDEKNIAISGIFGSGKSSLIKTYEKAYNNKKGKRLVREYESLKKESVCIANDLRLNSELEDLKSKPIKKSLRISLADFNISNDKKLQHDKEEQNFADFDKNDCETESDKIRKSIIELDKYKEHRQTKSKMDEVEIEKNLLQQFIFNVGSNKLPDSKIKRVNEKHCTKTLAFIFFLSSLLSVSIFSINKLGWIWGFNTIVEKIFTLFSFISIISLLASLTFLFTPKSLKIDKIEICAEEIQCNDDNLIGRFLDELIYFFERTKYEIIYFEDLDRLPDLKIFNKLRELNYILNNSESIKKKITFVYCISDSIISDYEERTKFFDKIITLQPFLTQEKVMSNLQKIISDNPNDVVAEFVHDMSIHIPESRLFNSIESDYQENIKKTDSSIILNKIKVMALCIYKNLYYYDYNKLNTKSACLSKCFNLLENIKHGIRQEKQDQIDKLYKLLNESKTDENAYLGILKERICGIINLVSNNSSLISYNSYGVDVRTIDTIENLKENNYFHINTGHSISKTNLNKYFYEKYGQSFDDIITNTEIKIEDAKNDILAKIQKIEKDIKSINELSLSEFMKKFEINLVDDENQFLNICLKKGYIDSDYMKFVFGENNSYLIEQDDAFVRYNNYFEAGSPAKDNYDYKLTNLLEITKQIYLEKFKCKTILNTQLIEYVLYESTDIQKYKTLISYLNSDDEDVLKFLTSYIKTRDFKEIKKLITKLGNPKSLINAYESLISFIDESKRCLILNFFINDFDLSLLAAEDQLILSRILNYNHVWISISINNKALCNLKNLSEIKLSSIVGLDVNSLNIIKNSDIFEINYDNIMAISKHLFNIEDSTKILESIITSNEEDYKNYILSNLATFLELFKEQAISENTLKILLRNDFLDDITKNKIITDCFFVVKDASDIDEKYINNIIKSDKLKHSFESVFVVFQKFENECIDKYFEREFFENMTLDYDSLSSSEGFDKFINYIISKYTTSDNALSIFDKFHISGINLDKQMTSFNDFNIDKLVVANKIEANESNFNNLVDCYKSYLHLIDKNIDLYMNLFNGSRLNFNNNLLTYILCNTPHRDIVNKIVNDFPEQINFDFSENIGISNNSYISKIWEVVLLSDIKNKDILLILSKHIIDSLELKISFMGLIKTSKDLFQNNTEILSIFEMLEERFKNCKSIGYQFICPDDLLEYGLTILKDLGIINTRKGKNKIKITAFNL